MCFYIFLSFEVLLVCVTKFDSHNCNGNYITDQHKLTKQDGTQILIEKNIPKAKYI